VNELGEQILQTLEQGRAAISLALQGVDEAKASRKPPTGGWSVLECLEHLSVAEDIMLRRVQEATAQSEPLLNPQREARILSLGGSRQNKRQAPEASHPAGRFTTLAQAGAALHVARARTLAWLQAHPNDLRCLVTTHPALPGPVSCHELLLLMGIHWVRHAGQIVEIKEKLAGSAPRAAGE
jgi:uncharacterized damage-inducible protein DinB